MSDILAGKRILVVEDEMLVLMNVEMLLEDMGCADIGSAGGVAEALALLDREVLGGRRFDAALLDVNLGGAKSYPIAEALIRLGVPLAFATGYGDHGDRADMERIPTIRKPYSPSDLFSLFQKLLADPLPLVV